MKQLYMYMFLYLFGSSFFFPNLSVKQIQQNNLNYLTLTQESLSNKLPSNKIQHLQDNNES